MLESSVAIKIKNDLPRPKQEVLFNKLKENTELTFSYILLLIASSVVSTLGLLLDNTAVVIGGMIISPLMWPLLKISLGLAVDNKKAFRRAFKLLFFSVLIGFLSAYLIAIISPIKQLNTEILSRTSPTIIDLVIALVAGSVAAFALLKPRISENLAGVAIAAALMPPLASSGIGLAFSDMNVFVDSFILFFVNVVAIVFITVFIFAFLVKKLHPGDILKRRGLVVIILALIFTAIPLLFLLRTYSYEVSAYSKTEQALTKGLYDISPSIYLSNLSVSIESGDSVKVVSEILLPEDITIDFVQQQDLVTLLKSVLDRNVDLSLRIQRDISIVTKERSEEDARKSEVTYAFISLLEETYPSLGVETVNAYKASETDTWRVNAVLRGQPKTPFGHNDVLLLKEKLEVTLEEPVEISVDVIPRTKVFSGDTFGINEKIKQTTYNYLVSSAPNIELRDLEVTALEGSQSADIEYNVSLSIFALPDLDLASIFEALKAELSTLFQNDINLNVHVTTKDEFSY
ncbi:TIGR00341 family protein [candidate division WWE3 bacterium]|jgi:uncharacterized hydrophobic protein (TIGR00271 family)|nr:TIGR00341 family protein [candidate division WWE3 bacterium]MBT7350447.1 TIGR00341 family protein [candidate division WWE3 bacterium]